MKDRADTLPQLRKKDLYWMFEIKTYAPYGVDKSEVYELFRKKKNLVYLVCIKAREKEASSVIFSFFSSLFYLSLLLL